MGSGKRGGIMGLFKEAHERKDLVAFSHLADDSVANRMKSSESVPSDLVGVAAMMEVEGSMDARRITSHVEGGAGSFLDEKMSKSELIMMRQSLTGADKSASAGGQAATTTTEKHHYSRGPRRRRAAPETADVAEPGPVSTVAPTRMCLLTPRLMRRQRRRRKGVTFRSSKTEQTGKGTKTKNRDGEFCARRRRLF